MQSGITIRGFDGSGMCHEIILSDGTAILMDPYFSRTDNEKWLETIQKADYILLTHAHFDHDIDVGYLVKKFSSKVIVGAFCAMDVMKFHHIPYDNLIPATPGEMFHFPEFTLYAYRAKHNNNGGRIYAPSDDIAKNAVGLEGHQACDIWGSVESLDFSLVTGDNFRIMEVAGETFWNDAFLRADEFHPDLLIRQAGRRVKGVQVEPAALAELFLRYHAPVVIPAHYDMLLKKMGREKTDAYFAEVGKVMAEKSASRLLVPECGRFYHIGVSVEEK